MSESVAEAAGVAGRVWALPVVALVLALGALVLAFRRWRAMSDVVVTDRDRERVDRALAELAPAEGADGPVPSAGHPAGPGS